MSTSVSTVSSSSSSNLSSVLSTAESSFVSEDTFLKLLITQLENQDPLNPQDSSQFVSQLASFSSLEQMTSLNTEMETVLEMNATNLVGKTAEVLTSSGTTVSGTISGITYYSDGPAVRIDGTDYLFSQVQNITS